jgi:hypothetical protein
MKFTAEIKEVKMRKLVSLDNEYRITLSTNDQAILELGKIPADEIVEVEVNVK